MGTPSNLMDEFRSHTDGPQSPEAKRALVARLLRERAAAVRQAPVAAAGHRAVPASGPSGPDQGAVRPVDRSAALPLSFAQQRFCLLEQLSTEPGFCNLPFSLKLTGTPSVERLERAFALLIERHLAFRTRFETVDGELRQSIGPPFTVPIPVVDLRSLADGERQAETERRVFEESRRPFDLESGRLLRILLIRTRDDAYVLLVTTHHAVADGWSAVIVLRELPLLYDAAAHGVAASLPVLPTQYIDYAVWQHARAGGPDAERDLAYWTERLAGAPPVLELPTDAPRPVAQTFRGAAHLSQLPPSLTAALKAFSRQRGVTPFMTLLSAFAVLMFRHTGQTDLVIGTPVAGRDRPEVEPIIGCFINTLALRIDVDPAASFEALLEQVRTTALDAYAHQDVPFERVIEAVHPRRDLARTPVFQVMFNMLGFDDGWRTQTSDVAFEAVSPAEEPSKFDLTFYVYGSDKLTLRVLYNAGLFAPARMVDFLEQMKRLLEQVVADPGQPVAHYSLVTPAARAVLPDPALPLPTAAEESVCDRVRAIAASDPDRLAVRDAGRAWSYAEVNAASDGVARQLRAGGVGAETVVAILANRRASLAAAVLGVWKAGAACLLLDARYPTARLAGYLELAKPAAWIDVSDQTLDVALAGHMPGLRVDVDPASAPDPVPCDAPFDLDRLAYVAFTSGSTGRPKGVAGTHRPVVHFLRWHVAAFGLHAGDRFSLLSGLSHDPVWRDLLTPLWVGGSLQVPADEVLDAPDLLGSWAAAMGVTVAHLTPPLLHMLAEGASGDGAALALRHVFVGGDSLDSTAVARLRGVAPYAQVVNFYGATETPQAMGVFVADGAPWTDGDVARRVPVGRGIDGVQLLVLNAAGHLAGVGERGEIVVRTPYLTRGYLGGHDDDGRFSINPFTEMPGDRVYRTGDLGRYLPSGDVECLGRADLQIKLRGIRIEPAEIEAAIRACHGVSGAAVAVHEPGTDRAVLIAYVTADGSTPDPVAIRAELATRLPSAMVPASIAVLDQMPLTPNGKLDRRRLPLVDVQAASGRPPFVAASTPEERALAEIWSDLLGVPTIGATDNFFDLGGHSLLATRLVSRIRTALDVHIPLRGVFEAPTIGAMARHVSALRWTLQAPPSRADVTEFEL